MMFVGIFGLPLLVVWGVVILGVILSVASIIVFYQDAIARDRILRQYRPTLTPAMVIGYILYVASIAALMVALVTWWTSVQWTFGGTAVGVVLGSIVLMLLWAIPPMSARTHKDPI